MRREIQTSAESVRVLAARLGISTRTVQKWRGRSTTADSPMGAGENHARALSPGEEARAVTFAAFSGMALDDLHRILRRDLPNLSRTTLHRYLALHGVAARSKRTSRATVAMRYRRRTAPDISLAVATIFVEEETEYVLMAVEQPLRKGISEMVREVTQEAVVKLLRAFVAGQRRYREGYIVLIEDGQRHVPSLFRPPRRSVGERRRERECLQSMLVSACRQCGAEYRGA
jgi:hypothetical protein